MSFSFFAVGMLSTTDAFAKDWYVSANKGKGKKGSKKRPAKDLGNITKRLKAGDTVHIAGGTYLGRGKNGSTVITVPVSIIGGYDESFTSRDPWGAHKTVLSGLNRNNKNWVSSPTLMIDLNKYRGKLMPAIMVDGLIVDNADRNRYKTDKQLAIVRTANPKKGDMPTPDRGGLIVSASKTGNFQETWNITVQNCVVMNTAPTQGALSVSAYKGSKVTVRNNIVMNNTGYGMLIGSKFMGSDNYPAFTVENNTVLFTWKYDSYVQSMPGSAIGFDQTTTSTVKHNVFAMTDRFAVDNIKKANILLAENLILGNVEADYLEFNTRINLADIEDEAEALHEDSFDNVADKITIPVSAEWAKNYGARVLIDRNAAEADIKVQQTRANDLRSILGLPLQADDLKTEESPVWLHRLSIDDAIKAGSSAYLGKYGASKANIK